MTKRKQGRICGIYNRCSTKEQKENGQSLDYQETACKEYIKDKNLAYFKTYRDTISGSSRHNKRPGMTKMFNDIKDGLIDAIVFQALDRLCRDLDASGEINLFLKDHNITMYQVRCEYNDETSGGKTMITVDRMLAQMELDRLKERTILGIKSKKRTFGWAGGRVPFGYEVIETDEEKKIRGKRKRNILPAINSGEAVTVKLIYDLYWTKNKKIKSISKYLNDNKIKTGQYNKNGIWINSSVIRILKDHKMKYDGCLINNNQVGNMWCKILDNKYNSYPRVDND